MTTRASGAIYDSPRLAAGYAFARPPVHDAIVERIAQRLGISAPVRRALDIGCGAGVSARALDAITDVVTGIEPASRMLAHRRTVFPRGQFVIGRGEALPFRDASFQLITAAGSINYTDVRAVLHDAARVLDRTGWLAIYDFSDGRRFENSRTLSDWYDEFERRYPPQTGYALDVRTLPFGNARLHLDAYEPFEVALTMTFDAYVRYAMSQTSVEAAIARGADERDIDRWCRSTLQDVFAGKPHGVVFDAYVAYVRHQS